ncbi:MAG TPA: hypothetical protein VN606_16820 [Thermoleophilaceae bacterium]|nr:hypothetical protein [Thermoleophilaceae bacterium]
MRFFAALLAAVATTLALGACGERHAEKHAASPTPVASACTAKIPVQLLPTWARTGFSDPKPHMPFVLGARGRIGAIVWGNPLLAPPAKDRSNKILWVSHAPFKPGGGDLTISAQRFEGGRAVGSPLARSVIGGPGPSLIDLPAGCWHLTLSWWGHTDAMDLEYSPAGKT